MTDQTRGRPRGPAPRGTCPTCGADRALRATGSMGAHTRRTPQGYSLGPCPGTDQPPRETA